MSDGPISLHDPQTLLALNTALRAENENLKAIVAALQRALYGARSEKQVTPDDQLPLALDDLSTTPVEPAKLPKPANSNLPVRPTAARNIGGLPAHLPRVDITIQPDSQACPCCQGKLHLIGEDVSEMLDVVSAVLRVKRIHRPRYGCRACEGAVVQAKAPPRPVDGGMPTIDLLVHIAVMKFAWHLPLHRQVKMLAGQGIDLDVSTLVHWISRLAWWLKPLHAVLAANILAAPKIFCDDTPLPVLDRTRKRTRIARLWAYATDDRPWRGPAPPAVVYLYAEDRKGRHVEEHLAGKTCVLQVDAYPGYNRLTRPDRPGGPITLSFCLAHARRKFFEIHKSTDCPVAAEALQRIAAIVIGPCSIPQHEWFFDLLGEKGNIATAHGKRLDAIMAIAALFNAIGEILSTAPSKYAPIFQRTDVGVVLAGPWCMGFVTAMKLRWKAWAPLLNAKNIEYGLLLPILLYCADELAIPAKPPPKGIDIKSYLKVAYHDIPIVVPSIRDFWMPQRVAEVSR
jgi:yecA family protein